MLAFWQPYKALTLQLDAFYVSSLVITIQIALNNCVHVPVVAANNVFYRSCSAYKFESEVAAFRYKLGLTLQEARQEARHTVDQNHEFLVKNRLSPDE